MRCPSCSRIATPAAQPQQLSTEVVREMMSFLACKPVGDDLAPLFLEDLHLDGADSGAVTWGDEIPADGEGRLAGRRHRLRGVGHRRRHPSCAGRSAVHDRREGSRAGRHLARQPLPGRARRRRQSPLLLLVRAGRPLVGVLLPSARARGVLHARARQVRAATALPLRHRGDRRHVGRRLRAVGAWPFAARTAPTETLDARFVISGVGSLNNPRMPDIPGHVRLRRSVVPLGPLAGRSRHLRHAVRARRRRRERLPDRADDRRRRRASRHLPAHRAVGAAEPVVPRAGSAGRRVGDAASAVLRALVPLPDDLPGDRPRDGELPARPELRRLRRPRQQREQRGAGASTSSGGSARSSKGVPT